MFKVILGKKNSLYQKLVKGRFGKAIGIENTKNRNDLSVIILGLTVTTSVFTPTSVKYFSDIGGKLHL